MRFPFGNTEGGRRVNKKTVSLMLTLVLAFMFFVSCKEKEFVHCELSLPLGDTFVEIESDDYDLLLSDGEIAVAVTRLTFIAAFNQGIADTYTAKAFANYFMKKSGKSDTLYTLGDIPYYTYTEKGKNTDMFYTVTFYRSLNAYFIVAYASNAQIREKTEPKMLEYAKSLYFNDAPKL